MRKKIIAGAVVCSGLAWGQTQVYAGRQTKNIDFSGAAETKPMKMGATLPSTCQTGDMFFSTVAQPGANLYACAGGNWIQSSGKSTTFQLSTIDAQTTNTNTVVTVNAGIFRNNNTVVTIPTAATIQAYPGTLPAGSQVWIEYDPPSESLIVSGNANVIMTGMGLTNISTSPGSAPASGFTPGRIPIATCTGGVVQDQWTTCTDARTPMSTVTLNPGPGIQISPQSDGSLTISAVTPLPQSTGGTTVSGNPTTYYAAGPGSVSCPSAVTAIGSYQFPFSANISPGDHINVVAWFKHTGNASNPQINIRWAGSANSVDTHTFGNVLIAVNDTWAMEVDAVILSSSSLATYTRYMRYGESGNDGGGTYTPVGLTIPSNLLVEFISGGCSGSDTIQLLGSRITLSKAGSL